MLINDGRCFYIKFLKHDEIEISYSLTWNKLIQVSQSCEVLFSRCTEI